MIGILAYGSGNVAAITNILKQRKIPYILSGDSSELIQADRFILPGVGAFDPTMETLEQSGLVSFLNDQVLDKGKKVLGICVGMHLLAEGSEEGTRPGLGWIKGYVRKIDVSKINRGPHLPHMGWNSLIADAGSVLFDGVDMARGFYFLHSYFFDAADVKQVSARVEYGSAIPCAVEYENIYGMQFHPEKSHSNGIRLLQNFAELS